MPFVVSTILIQGRADAPQWVTSFRLAVSDDGTNFEFVTADGSTSPSAAAAQTFTGNTDQVTVVTVSLPVPITTRHVRLLPLTFTGHYSLRWEILACEASSGSFFVLLARDMQ